MEHNINVLTLFEGTFFSITNGLLTLPSGRSKKCLITVDFADGNGEMECNVSLNKSQRTKILEKTYIPLVINNYLTDSETPKLSWSHDSEMPYHGELVTETSKHGATTQSWLSLMRAENCIIRLGGINILSHCNFLSFTIPSS